MIGLDISEKMVKLAKDKNIYKDVFQVRKYQKPKKICNNLHINTTGRFDETNSTSIQNL